MPVGKFSCIVLNTVAEGILKQMIALQKCIIMSVKKRCWTFFSFLPFIVKSRADQALFHNLMQDNHPVLLEGQHTAFFANRLQKSRQKSVDSATQCGVGILPTIGTTRTFVVQEMVFYLGKLQVENPFVFIEKYSICGNYTR